MIFRNLCPNCGGEISEFRLRRGLPCSNCLPDEYLRDNDGDIYVILRNIGRAKGILNTVLLEEEMREFENFFEKYFSKKFWPVQRSWAKRLLSKESFALVAPTGIGKTTLLLAYALFRALKGGNVIYVVPTIELSKQVISTLRSVDLNGKVKIMESKEFKKYLVNGNKKFSNLIVVCTHAFLHRNKELLRDLFFDLVIVDDFDAVMKSSSVLNLILNLIGIDDETIKLALKIIKLKMDLMFYKVINDEEKYLKTQESLYKAEYEFTKRINYNDVGQLLIASATGRARGIRAKILRELLRFELGSILDYLRNIIDIAEPLTHVNLVNLIKDLHKVTLLFISKDMGMAKAREVLELLKDYGIRAEVAKSAHSLNKLRSGDVDVLIGIATYYGVLTRGIDEPKRVYNTIFLGIPKFEVPLDTILQNPLRLVSILHQLRNVGYTLSDEENSLVRLLRKLNPSKIRAIRLSIKNGIELKGHLGDIVNLIKKVSVKVKEFISKYVSAKGKLVLNEFIVVLRHGKLYALIPDVMTYIQASGRCSRLFNGRMTLGLSILLFEDEDLFNIFMRKIRNFIIDYNPKRLSDIDLDKVKKEQVRSREEFFDSSFIHDNIKPVLIVVESPTKAKTIAKMFGRPGRRYLGDYVAYETVINLDNKIFVATIAPTLGHVFDLVINEGLYGVRLGSELIPVYTTIKRCRECGHQFTDEVAKCPKCGSAKIRDSIVVINALRKLAQEVDVVYLATDPDEEGEKISYDVYLALRPYVSKFYRIEFHEVTKSEFLRALRNPRSIDLMKVNAQVVRRVDDRLIGFELSSILQRNFGKPWLGGGRVQTPVLKWIVDRYSSYIASKGYLVVLNLRGLRVKLFVKSKKEVEEIIRKVSSEGVWVEVKGEEIKDLNPKPPYTTDTLLSEASRALNLPLSKVMKLAQDLFELGFITYHRTDSTHVSALGRGIAEEYLSSIGLGDLFTPRSWGEKGTHECIRPTRPIASLDNLAYNAMTLNLTYAHKALYDLIFKRFIASQMSSAKVKYVKVSFIILDDLSINEVLPIEIVSNGFNLVYPITLYEWLRNLRTLRIKPDSIKVYRSSKNPLYTVADIVKLMKTYRIGRPSTYAKALENNLRHGYIVLSKRRLKVIPTKLGIEVIKFIEKNYPELTSTELTRALEALLDGIKLGRVGRSEGLMIVFSDLMRLRYDQVLETFLEDYISYGANST